MNRKQLGILLILIILLGGAGILLLRKQNQAWKTDGPAASRQLLPNFPVNDVARISIRRDTNELNLVKRDDLWRIRERQEYPASFAQISQFLIKARDWKAVQSEPVGPSQLARFQLAPSGQGTNSALVLEFKGQNNKMIATLLVGKPHLQKSSRPSPYGGPDEGWPDGRYVKVAESPTVALISDTLETLEPKPENWLDKDFIKVDRPCSIEVIFPEASNSWKLTRETESADWKLADARAGEQLDAAKARTVAGPLASPSFTDVIAGSALGDAGSNAPVRVVVGTFDRFQYAIVAGAKTNDQYPVTVSVSADLPKERERGLDEKPEDKARLDKDFTDKNRQLEEKLKQEQRYANWTFLVQSWSFDSLLKQRTELLVQKAETTEPGEATSADAAASPGSETNAPATLQDAPASAVMETNQPAQE